MFQQENYFTVSVQPNFCQRQIHSIADQHKFQFVTDTGFEYTKFQSPRRKLQAYKVQFNRLKDSESDSYDKINMKGKVNDLVKLHKVIEKKMRNSIIFRANPNTYFGI